MKKRILALALCIIMLFCALPFTAMADTANVIEDSALLSYLIGEGYDLDDNGAISATEAGDILYVDVAGLGVTSLEGLQYATNMFWLDASGNSIADITPVKALDLWIVDLSYNNISGVIDFSEFGWASADNVTLSHNEIESVANISALSYVAFLDVSYNKLSDVTELLGFSGLETLIINNNCYSLNPSDADYGYFAQIQSENTGLAMFVYAPQLVGSVTEDFVLDITDAGLLEALIANGVDVTGDGKISACELGNVYTKLNLANYGISDISALSYAVNAPAIDLGENEITSVDALAGLTKLKELDISGNNIESIDALSALTALVNLDAADNSIEDISVLSGFTALVNLDLSRNDISDISALSGLTELKALDLSDNFISGAEFSSSFDSLNLSYNVFTSTDDLVGIVAGTLDITYNNLDASAISAADFASVTTLSYEAQTEYEGSYRDAVNIPDAALLDILLRNKHINTNGDNVITKGELAGYGDTLDLDGTAVTDITGLRYMKRLSTLRLDNTAVSDISEMASMTRLRIFTAANSSVSNIAPLAKLHNLEYITVPNTNVSDISVLSDNELYALISVNLKGNGITDASALGNIPTLKSIRLSSNNITDASFISSLTAPEKIYLDNNKIESVDVMYDLTSLIELDVSTNCIDIPLDFEAAMYANNAGLKVLRYDNQDLRISTRVVIEAPGGNFFNMTIDGYDYGIQDGYTNSEVYVGTKFTVNALEMGEGEFLYWKIDGGKIVSYEEEYSFILISSVTLTAVFSNTYASRSYVSFYSDSDQELFRGIFSHTTSPDRIESVVPVSPTKTGYEFIGWSIDGSTVIAADELAQTIVDALPNGNVNVRPMYVALEDYRKVTVINGSGSGRYIVSTVVEVVANEPEEGMKFAYWVDSNGQILGYNTSYVFVVTGDTTLEAVYTEADADVGAGALITITDKSYDAATGKMTFVVARDVPTSYTVIQTGIILTSDAVLGADSDAFVIDATGTLKGTAVSTANVGAYIAAKGNVKVGDTWYARGYVVYMDADGAIFYLYSSIESMTA